MKNTALMKALLASLIIALLLVSDSQPILCLDSSLVQHGQLLQKQRKVLEEKSFSEMLNEATQYFSEFSFQEYQAFRRRRVKRSLLYVHALRDFFANFRHYLDLSEYRYGMVFPQPGENSHFDYLYALSLTTHYISSVGQLPLALRDGFRPISLHDLLVKGLSSKSLGREVHKEVQKNRDLVFLYLQARFNASVYFALYPVYGSEQSFLHIVSEWQYDFEKFKSDQHLTQLGFLLESAIEVRDVLERNEIPIIPVFVSRFGFSQISLSEILAQMNIPHVKPRDSRHRHLYAKRITELLQRLKKQVL